MTPSSYLKAITPFLRDFMEPFVPSVTMTAHYGDHRMTNCSELSLSMVRTKPLVCIGGENDGLYTLVMIDPDEPSPNNPWLREMVSWIVTNIPGQTSSAEGTEFLPYEAPNPEIGLHRYIMLLYQQELLLNMIQPLTSRAQFRTLDFANQHNLKGPVGLTYFYARKPTKNKARS